MTAWDRAGTPLDLPRRCLHEVIVRLEFSQYLPASPKAVWPYLSDPALMSLWSEAAVKRLATGDSDAPWSVGTLRQITIRSFNRSKAFEEVIEEAEPGSRLVYRVIAGLPVRRHVGEITLKASGKGTQLRWTVDMEFPLPGMAEGARFILVPQLRASLRKLAEVVQGARAPRLQTTLLVVDDTADLERLYDVAEDVLASQRKLGNQLAAQDDPKQWFARVYELVTENQIRACREGLFGHPGWVLQIIPRFDYYFKENLARWMDGRPEFCEQHWRSSFRAMETAHRWKGTALEALTYGIAKGMQAHIEEDLPRTLAEVYFYHYRDRCAYGRFRADYLRMTDIFSSAADQLLEQFPQELIPRRLRLFHALPREFKDPIMARYYYDIARERRRSFERGARLAALMGAKLPDGLSSEPVALDASA